MITRTYSRTLLTALLWAFSAAAFAEPSLDADSTPPSWNSSRSFSDLGRPRDQLLLGIRNAEQVEFRLRHDRIATAATLHLDYTPSPALIPVLSHLRVYLNDELMGTLPITQEQIGQRVRQELALTRACWAISTGCESNSSATTAMSAKTRAQRPVAEPGSSEPGQPA